MRALSVGTSPCPFGIAYRRGCRRVAGSRGRGRYIPLQGLLHVRARARAWCVVTNRNKDFYLLHAWRARILVESARVEVRETSPGLCVRRTWRIEAQSVVLYVVLLVSPSCSVKSARVKVPSSLPYFFWQSVSSTAVERMWHA